MGPLNALCITNWEWRWKSMNNILSIIDIRTMSIATGGSEGCGKRDQFIWTRKVIPSTLNCSHLWWISVHFVLDLLHLELGKNDVRSLRLFHTLKYGFNFRIEGIVLVCCRKPNTNYCPKYFVKNHLNCIRPISNKYTIFMARILIVNGLLQSSFDDKSRKKLQQKRNWNCFWFYYFMKLNA